MARLPKKITVPVEVELKVQITDKEKLLDIIAEVIQRGCQIPGCLAKWHREEAQIIVNRLRAEGLLRE